MISFAVSPLVMILVAGASLFLAFEQPQFQLKALFFSISALTWLRFIKQLKYRHTGQKLAYWLVGQERWKNKLMAVGAIGSLLAEEPEEYKLLSVSIVTNPSNADEWLLTFKNSGWCFLSSVLISQNDVLDLIAPGVSRLDEGDRRLRLGDAPLSELAYEIETKALAPKCSCTVSVPKVSEFAPRASSVRARFRVRSVATPYPKQYVIGVKLA